MSLEEVYDKEEIDKKYHIRPFIPVPPTKEHVDTVDITSIDISQYIDGPEGLESRIKLAKQLETSIITQGFFNIINYGFDQSKLEKLYSIAQSLFELPESEKIKYHKDKNGPTGNIAPGFKPREYWYMQNGVRDQIEFFNFQYLTHKNLKFKQNHPEILRAYLNEYSDFYNHIQYNILPKLSNLCDIILEKPEGFLWKFWEAINDKPELSGTGYARLMLYHPMDEKDLKQTHDTWLRGHSDLGSFTFLTSQPMCSLQIRDIHTGTWKYVPYVPNSLVVNVGDTLEFLTGGYFKSTIHRVTKSPKDQLHHKRLQFIYFNSIKQDTVIDPETLDSPKLKRLGYKKPENWPKITAKDWAKGKSTLFGQEKLDTVDSDLPNIVYIYERGHERWHDLIEKTSITA